jgi:hypothetical protein
MAEKIVFSEKDKAVLRKLGEWKAKTAQSPENKEKIKAWKEHDSGVPGARVMVRCETWYTQEDVKPVMDKDLQCEHPLARAIEQDIRVRMFEIENLKEDNFVLPYVAYAPHIETSNFGIENTIERDKAGGLGFHYTPQLKTLDDSEFAKIHHRTSTWRKDIDDNKREVLEDVFKGICKVRRRLHDWQLTCAMTSIAFDFVGLDGFMMLLYDNPGGVKRLMQFIHDDHVMFFDFLQNNDLLSLNNEDDYIGSGCQGCSDNLPAKDFAGKVRTKDMWLYTESQESVNISPDHYGEFVFPHIKDLAERFGRVYYGCCEPVNPMWKYVSTINTLQRVSVSPWANEELMGRYCRERKVVYSRKPSPNFFMAPKYDEGAVKAYVEKTVACAEGCRLEFIQRDVYVTNNDPSRFRKWVELVREAATKHKG